MWAQLFFNLLTRKYLDFLVNNYYILLYYIVYSYKRKVCNILLLYYVNTYTFYLLHINIRYYCGLCLQFQNLKKPDFNNRLKYFKYKFRSNILLQFDGYLPNVVKCNAFNK